MMLSRRCAALPRRCHPQPSTILRPGSIIHARRALSTCTPTRPTIASSARHLRAPSSSRALGTLVHSLADSLSAVHASTGIPWYILVPALASVINLVRVPFRPHEKRWTARSIKMSVLQQAWFHKAHQLGIKPPNRRAAKEFGRIRSQTGLQTWKLLLPTLAYMPTWIMFSQVLRTLAGAADKTAPLDPSLTTGGALWFLDLAAPDPLFILPTMVCASMLYNFGPKTMAETQELFNPNVKTMGMRIRRIVLLGAPIMLFVAKDQPAIIFVYWLSTIWMGKAMTRGIDKLYPSPPKSPWSKVVKINPWFINGPK